MAKTPTTRQATPRAATATATSRPASSTRATVGNPDAGEQTEGMTADQHVAVDAAEDLPEGLSAEQEDMEIKRRERGAAIRGTGDMPAPVHGISHHVETTGAAADRVHSVDRFAPTELPERTIKVRAIKLGYYDDKRRRTGDVFLIREPYDVPNTEKVKDPDTGKVEETITIDEFSDKWMEYVDADTPERITTGKEALRQQHDEELAARRTRNDDVIGD